MSMIQTCGAGTTRRFMTSNLVRIPQADICDILALRRSTLILLAWTDSCQERRMACIQAMIYSPILTLGSLFFSQGILLAGYATLTHPPPTGQNLRPSMEVWAATCRFYYFTIFIAEAIYVIGLEHQRTKKQSCIWKDTALTDTTAPLGRFLP